ncbi:hypothetical protein FRACYDRAFT_269723 [Fragilariopsis cylindrus CCMP1102]|uniref:Uncharacterized protein n=1 Tax=Fragilariopsis cylindrus CCMP1102 TaxID=635003 RepID=A0A1E7FAT7_9STRA|nr:hypothetical protein FRACYDRAFT_269723 [Fragilariopsis cylindrus CCMP1102]|eukprot:OEU14953.1 hypothetical protein FRACYDRAFT_269723 [Fragilariopsis cylindrus CCMP1102]
MTSSINKSMKNNSTINSDSDIVDDLEKGTTTLPLSSSSSSPMSLKRIIGVFVLLSLCGFAAILQQQEQGQGRHRSLASIGGDINNVNADGSSNNNNNNSNNLSSGNSACTRSNPDCTNSPISIPVPEPVPVPTPSPTTPSPTSSTAKSPTTKPTFGSGNSDCTRSGCRPTKRPTKRPTTAPRTRPPTKVPSTKSPTTVTATAFTPSPTDWYENSEWSTFWYGWN